MNHSKEQMRALQAAQALEWFIAHRSGTLTETQRQEFIDWLRASPAHAQEYLALTGFVRDFGEVARTIAMPAEELVERARAERDTVQSLTLFPAPDAETEERHVVGKWSWRGMQLAAALAAVVVAVVMVGAVTWWTYDRTVYSTAHAEQRSWRMPDGSTVHLNSNSEIKVKFDARRREIQLIRGQALFQVAKDPQRPFWVHTGEAAVKAVGTEFDVYRQPRRTLISVVEGRVAVWRLQSDSVDQPVARLESGQQAQITREATFVRTRAADVRKTVAWLQRQVIFDHDPLGAAIEEFNRYAELRIRIDDPALRTVEVSGIFSAYDAEAFVRFLERQPEMRLRRVGNEVIVEAAL